MTSSDVKSRPVPDAIPVPFLGTYCSLFDENDLLAMARQNGAVARQRKVDVPALVEASVLAMSGLPGTQTTILANYLQLTGQSLAPSAFYDRFSDSFANLMADVSRRAIAAVRAIDDEDAEARELARLLQHFNDVHATDSTCQLLCKLAAHWSPSTSPERPASFKIHSIISLVDMLPIEHHVSPQREHDSPHLDESALTPGALLLADLGYVDHDRLMRLDERGISVVMRLKNGQNPRIRRVRIGKGHKRACRNMPLDDALSTGQLDFVRGRLDVDVVLQTRRDGRVVEAVFRVIGLEPTDGGDDRYYLTNVPAEILNPHDVALAYRLRWDIELLWKHLKTGTGLTALRAWRPSAVFALVQAKITAVALARLLQLAARPSTRGHAVGQLAIVLALHRSIPLILSLRMRGKDIDLLEMERRLLLVASTLGRSRRQRRERKKKAQRAGIASNP